MITTLSHRLFDIQKKICLICFTDKLDQNMNFDDSFNAEEYLLLGKY